MRSDLEKIKGIKDITTDFKTTIATFKIAMSQADLKKELDAYAKKNEYLKNWSFMDPATTKDGKKPA